MSVITKCKKCGKKSAHYYKSDAMCMQCEMEEYYPGDGEIEMNVRLLQSAAQSDESLKKTRKIIAKIKSYL